MNKLHELRQAYGKAVDLLETLTGDEAKFNDQMKEVDRLKGEIDRAQRAQDVARGLARPGAGEGAGDPTKQFKNLGEQLIAIARHYMGGNTDERLIRAPIGAGETDPSAGGFLVQTDFAAMILTRAYDMGEIAKKLFRLSISNPANSIKIPGVDETSRATGSRWGGVQSYWVGEGDQATATKPKFRLIELDLKKLMAIWYVSDELMADAAALTGIANRAFAEEFTFMIEDSTIHGSGAGMPHGILNSACTVQVAADKGQASKTLTYNNVLAMWARMWARSRKDAQWYINQDVEPQLYQLNQVIGTGGHPVYLPPGGISEAPYGTLFGRPVVPVEYCETIGTPGDVILGDFSQYVMADKASMQQMSSVHVRFLTDEMTFRLTYRCDGEPIWRTPLTPFKGANTLSPFVTLAQR
ncbi:MAG: phage major capsid protein [Stellaceae bacterium]